MLKVYATRKTEEGAVAKPGTIVVDGRRLLVKCGDNYVLELVEVQLAGKKRMPATDFINGMKDLGEYHLE